MNSSIRGRRVLFGRKLGLPEMGVVERSVDHGIDIVDTMVGPCLILHVMNLDDGDDGGAGVGCICRK